MKLIAGLGNPGREYDGTRHNIGFDLVDRLAAGLGIVYSRKFSSLYAAVEFKGEKLILLKPQEYMNRSGQAVATAAGFFKIPLSDILVVTDDLALDPGNIRLRASGSAGGHNGLKDIISKLGSEKFARLRIGIGSNRLYETKNYVLGRPDAGEKQLIDKALEQAEACVRCWIENGPARAMNEYNNRQNGSE